MSWKMNWSKNQSAVDCLDGLVKNHMSWKAIADKMTDETSTHLTPQACRRAWQKYCQTEPQASKPKPEPEPEQESIVSGLRRALKKAEKEADIAATTAAFMQDVVAKNDEKTRVVPVGHRGRQHVTPTLVISDTHFDEVIDPGAISNANRYNREVAISRMETLIQRSMLELNHQVGANVTVDEVVVDLVGDILSGEIHDELIRTNDATIQNGLLFWINNVAALIATIAKKYPSVYVPCVIGNHGRDGKWHTKRAVQRSFDWLFYMMLASKFANDERIKFDVATGVDHCYNVYGRKHLMTHGDGTNGGKGLSGFLPLLSVFALKKFKEHRQDRLICGHYHILLPNYMGITVNGSLKGFDEFASKLAFSPNSPQQLLFFDTPPGKTTLYTPIYVD